MVSNVEFHRVAPDLPRVNDTPSADELDSALTLPRQREQAIAAFDRESLSHEPHSTSLQAAQLLMAHSEWRLAKALLLKELSGNSYSQLAMLWLGRCCLKTGELKMSECCARELCRLAPSSESFALLGEVAFENKRDTEALKYYLRALLLVKDEGPLLFELYKNIGNVHSRARDFDSAQENYDRAYTMKPDSDALMVNYGALEVTRENYAEATDRFRWALRLNPRNERAWIGLSIMHRHLGDHRLAWANLLSALDLDPLNVTALKLGIDWGLTDHQIEVILPRLRNYVDNCGEDVEMMVWLAQLCWQKNLLSEAWFEAERALLLQPDHAAAQQIRTAILEIVHKRGGW